MPGIGLGIGVAFSRGGGFSPEYQAVYDEFTTKPNSTVAYAQNAMVKKLAADGNWDRIDADWLFAGHTNDNGESFLNWKNPTGDAALGVDSPIHRPYQGFVGDAISKAVNLRWNPTDDGDNYTQDAAAFIVATYKVGSSGSAFSFGGYGSLGTKRSISVTNGRTIINSGFNTTGAGTAKEKFFTTAVRDGANSVHNMIDKETPTDEAVVSGGISDADFWALCAHTGGTPEGFDDGTIAAIIVGNFTTTQAGQIIDALNTYLTAVENEEYGIARMTFGFSVAQLELKLKAPSIEIITIDWGDGNVENFAGQDAVEIVKTSAYTGAGSYDVTINGNATALTHIDLSQQAGLSGDIEHWGALTGLTYLDCGWTGLEGNVNGWSALTSLAYLDCSRTFLTGDVSGWSVLTNLTHLECYSTEQFQSESIYGDISGWSALTSLTYLDASTTSCSGDLSSWSALINLTTLACHDGVFTGDISGWSAITGLVNVHIHQAFYSGDISGWTACTGLESVVAYSNPSITGDVSGWSVLTSLWRIRLGTTGITGDVSVWSALTSLTILRLQNTALSGDISGWVALSGLEELLLSNVPSITADISIFSGMTSLVRLDLFSSTGLIGDLSDLSTLVNLIEFRAYSTNLTFDNTPVFSLTGLMYVQSNGWTATMVDNCLASLAATPVQDMIITMAGNNATRTSGSDADVVIIETPANNNTLDVNE